MAVPQVREAFVDDLLLNGNLRIEGHYQWQIQPNKSWARIQIQVTNDKSKSLRLVITVNLEYPETYSISLLFNNAHRIRGFDHDGSHKNKHTNQERWLGESHFHKWSDICHDRFCYSPTRPEGNSIQENLELFCDEFGISCAVQLGDLPPRQPEMLI